MKTYWDLTEQERANLTEEQVKAFADVELMQKGVLKPIEPVVMENPEHKPLTPVVWISVGDVYFRTIEQANEFLKLDPHKAEADYRIGYDISWAAPLSDTPQSRNLYSPEEVLKRKAELMEYKAKEKEIKEQKKAYQEAIDNVKNACSDLWSDYYDMCSLKRNLQKVQQTWAEYLVMTNGDKEIAKTFLLKVFDEETISKSLEWFGEVKRAEVNESL